MKKVFRVLNLLTPGIAIIVIGYYSISPNFLHIDHSLFILALLFLFPLLFLLQGVVTVLIDGSIFVALGVSVLAFLVILLAWMNSSAFVYIPVYFVLGYVGYWISRKILKKK
ncbi:hypothetical protein DS745_03990 [Anaerobacillus alkaliphilus]|uniref:Uncharacterized protein n=1 Tax=Anaerobacillus alkaliphilus TaxID=1548597 RepID=A0A4Q0VXS5_9BACI|nr:hypothetical protein [Anaerobacillus alkaliphilus]RXJ04553.1 hypothetical protein DS745_03990 [Anaerobacillus alkaliphilus]